MKPQAYGIANCSRDSYDSIQAINQSNLKHFQKSAAHFRNAVTTPRKPATKAMILGHLVEHLLLGTEFKWEPMKFKDFKKDEAKLWRDELKSRGIEIIDAETLEKAQSMASRVRPLPEWIEWHPWRTNVALVGIHEPTGLAMKGLCDIAPDNVLVIPDLKTTDDASPEGFGRSISTYGYDIQGWWYQYLWRQVYGQDRQMSFVCIESEPPYEPSIQVLHQSDIDRAGRAVTDWMAQYKRCLDTDTWPGYPSGLIYAQLPPYRLKQYA